MKHIFMGKILTSKEIFVSRERHIMGIGFRIITKENELDALIIDNNDVFTDSKSELKGWEIIKEFETMSIPFNPLYKKFQLDGVEIGIESVVPTDTGNIICYSTKIIRTEIDEESVKSVAELQRIYDDKLASHLHQIKTRKRLEYNARYPIFNKHENPKKSFWNRFKFKKSKT